MKSDLQFWRNKVVYDLIDAVLLIVEKNPEKYSNLEELEKSPPANFIPIYKDMLLDAVSIEGEAVQSEESTDEFYTRYVLHTDQSDGITTKTVLSFADGRNYTINKSVDFPEFSRHSIMSKLNWRVVNERYKIYS